ncbi:MAG: histidinol-phosphatase [Bacteroidales bacterium]|nr:histidinol-phosphatase [Bacteroidales bacterium]
MIKANYHSHSTFCDGKSSMEEMVLSAIGKNFTHFGISSHAPVQYDNDFALKEENFIAYKQEFLRLKGLYADRIKLFIGLEMDYIPQMAENLRWKAEKYYQLDYFIGSVHQVKEKNASFDTWFIDGSKQEPYDEGLKNLFDGDIRRAVGCYFAQQIEMIELYSPDVLGHPDKVVMHNKDRYFHIDEPWYKDLVYSLFDTVIKHSTIVEVNTRGIYRKRYNDYYPSTPFLKYLIEKNVPLIVSTDCHKAEEADCLYQDAVLMLQSLGCKELFYFDGTWKCADIKEFL